jgi:anti-sigma factor RsiW
MTSPSDIPRLNAFVDGELDLEAQLALETRLRDDAGLRAHVERLRAVREQVRDKAHYHTAPSALRERVDALVATRAVRAVRAPWFAWRPWTAAMATAAAAVLALNLWVLLPREQQRIEQDVIASHVRATLGQRQVDVASSDHHTVKPWLSARLDFSPPVRELDGGGSALLGGRVDYVGGRPVAALAYRYAGHMVDDFVWPRSGGDQPVTQSASRGFNIAHWSRGGMTHWLISDLNATELAQLARELSSGN